MLKWVLMNKTTGTSFECDNLPFFLSNLNVDKDMEISERDVKDLLIDGMVELSRVRENGVIHDFVVAREDIFLSKGYELRKEQFLC